MLKRTKNAGKVAIEGSPASGFLSKFTVVIDLSLTQRVLLIPVPIPDEPFPTESYLSMEGT